MAKKRTVPQGGGTVLYFSPPDRRSQAVPALCALLKIRCSIAGPEDASRTVGNVMGLRLKNSAASPEGAADDVEGKEVSPENGPDRTKTMKEPMLVLCGVPGKTMEYLFRELKDRGLRIPLKASLTETNIGWSLERLYRELSAEHEAMTGEKL